MFRVRNCNRFSGETRGRASINSDACRRGLPCGRLALSPCCAAWFLDVTKVFAVGIPGIVDERLSPIWEGSSALRDIVF